MKAIVLALSVVAALAATGSAAPRPAAVGSRSSTALLRLPRTSPAGEQTLWGHLKSLTRKGGRWQLKFDPGLLLRGTAAEHAAFEDTGSSDVPNDSYTVEESHRLYTFTLSASAPVTVLVNGPKTARISVSELAQILAGKNPKKRPLFGRPADFGFWIGVGSKYPNPVVSIDEQYQP
jgi:hypothetical protein